MSVDRGASSTVCPILFTMPIRFFERGVVDPLPGGGSRSMKHIRFHGATLVFPTSVHLLMTDEPSSSISLRGAGEEAYTSLHCGQAATRALWV